MNFGQAIENLKEGFPVAREGWNGKGMFIFMQVPAEIPVETIPKMQSLPNPVKEHLLKRGVPLKYSNQLAIVHPDNRINGWTPSVSDTLADDWTVVFPRVI